MISGQKCENSIRRNYSDFPATKRMKLALGKFLLKFNQNRSIRIDQEPFAKDSSRFDHLIRNGLYADAFEKQDFARLRRYLSHYWGQMASSFHQDWQDRFQRMFLDHDKVLTDELQEYLKQQEGSLHFNQLYEIGCGGGQLLDYLAENLATDISEFIGIDLGEDQIESNQTSCERSNVSFHAADAVKWIPKNAKSNSVFITNGGVFEYFLKEELESLFEHIAKNLSPSVVGIIETIGTDHDLETQTETFLYGREMAFSHNYPSLLKNAGFTIIHQSERANSEMDGGGRWLRVLAVTAP